MTLNMNYTQEELDRCYDQSVWDCDSVATIDSYEEASKQVRNTRSYSSYSYGETQRETVDVFAPDDADRSAVIVFIHGGAWRGLSKNSVSAYAPTFVDAGHVYVAVDFDNVPDTTISGMVDQCRRALIWVWRHAEEFGGDRDRIILAGHSSGGHLSTVLLGTDWSSYNVPDDLIKGGAVLSGMCDLDAPQRSARGKYMKLSEQQVHELSAIHYIERVSCPVVVAYGTKESPEFIRQSEDYARALRGHSRLSDLFALSDVTHFEVPNILLDPTADLTRSVLALVPSEEFRGAK
ncbi:alpha/beta hydrolase [Corynebacterium sp. A21]|uniref:alpha/beta hydrolase n=1 Tax=Corynebacterium sp. A21 TaxID=3457318 RepID=UPI003FD5E08E